MACKRDAGWAAVLTGLMCVGGGCGDAVLETAQPVRLRVVDEATGKSAYGVTVQARQVNGKPREMSAGEWVAGRLEIREELRARAVDAVTDEDGRAIVWFNTSRIASGIIGQFDSAASDRVSGGRYYVGWQGKAGLDVGQLRVRPGESVLVGARRVTIVEVGPAVPLREMRTSAARPATQTTRAEKAEGVLTLEGNLTRDAGSAFLVGEIIGDESVPGNDEVRWDGNFVGLYLADVADWRRRAERVGRAADGEKVLVEALRDPRRFVAAHVMLTLLTGGTQYVSRAMSAEGWNGLRVERTGLGNRWDPEEQRRAMAMWGERPLWRARDYTEVR